MSDAILQLLNVSEACACLRCGRTRFYELAAAGEFALLKIGRRTLVRSDELRAYVERLTDAAAGRAHG